MFKIKLFGKLDNKIANLFLTLLQRYIFTPKLIDPIDREERKFILEVIFTKSAID